LPDMKKKNAVRNSIEPKFGRGGGGAMNVPGGRVAGGASVVRGERGDTGLGGWSPGGSTGGTGSDMATVVPYVVVVVVGCTRYKTIYNGS
jgi:hypothetical protein